MEAQESNRYLKQLTYDRRNSVVSTPVKRADRQAHRLFIFIYLFLPYTSRHSAKVEFLSLLLLFVSYHFISLSLSLCASVSLSFDVVASKFSQKRIGEITCARCARAQACRLLNQVLFPPCSSLVCQWWVRIDERTREGEREERIRRRHHCCYHGIYSKWREFSKSCTLA